MQTGSGYVTLWSSFRRVMDWGILEDKEKFLVSSGNITLSKCALLREISIESIECLPSWLRHCLTSRKVAGLIPVGVIEIFHWFNPSTCTMVMGLTQPLTEWVPRVSPGGWRWPVRRAENLVATFMCRLSRNTEILNLLRACLGPYIDIQNQIVYRPLKKGVVLNGVVN